MKFPFLEADLRNVGCMAWSTWALLLQAFRGRSGVYLSCMEPIYCLFADFEKARGIKALKGKE
jgi:hypothetical protein